VLCPVCEVNLRNETCMAQHYAGKKHVRRLRSMGISWFFAHHVNHLVLHIISVWF
jgi:hypothetical protein